MSGATLPLTRTLEEPYSFGRPQCSDPAAWREHRLGVTRGDAKDRRVAARNQHGRRGVRLGVQEHDDSASDGREAATGR